MEDEEELVNPEDQDEGEADVNIAGENEEEGAQDKGPKEEEEEGEHEQKEKSKKTKKKGNWKFIGHEPVTYELRPCTHKWKKEHPRGPCPHYKQIRWVTVPTSERVKQLAMPLLRRLLNLWLEHGDKLPPEMRERLQKNLARDYGLSEEFLDQILEEAVKTREEEKKRKEKEAAQPGSKKRTSLTPGQDEEGDEDEEDEDDGSGKKKKKKGKKGKKQKKKKKDKKKKGKKDKGKKSKGKKSKGKKDNGKGKGKKKKKGKEGGDKKKKGKKKKSDDDSGEEGGDKKKKKKEAAEGKGKGKKGSGLFFKRKPGKFPVDWAYKTGTKFIMSCISYLSRDPDEDYNSRAPEYFDVQSMAILELLCDSLGIGLPHPERPTQYGEALVIMALNLSNWIAKYVVTPAQLIPDDKVNEYLELRGQKPKKPKGQKKEKKEKKPPKGKKGKKKDDGSSEDIEPVKPVERHWDEHKVAVYVPEKSRISKRKNLEEEEGEVEEERKQAGDGYVEPDILSRRSFTLDEVKQQFLEYIYWYNPWEPEFMYLGPRSTPDGIYMFKLMDAESEEVPSDLRFLNWNQYDYGLRDNYSFIPSPVPEYYPSLRPLRPLRLNNMESYKERSENMKESVYDYSPWYLMNTALKPSSPEAVTENAPLEEVVGEFDVDIEDEMLQSEKQRPIQDSVWGDFVMKEQLDIFGHLLHLMTSVPDLTEKYVFELLEEFCTAVECAELDENPSPENRLLIDKRTIILEQYFLEFFGKKFRDYNDRTPIYMRVICRRCAYYIQLLFECTARVLWEFQSAQNRPSILMSRPETPDDPAALKDWDEWLDWLLQVTKTCDEWAGWISETVKEAEKKAAKKKDEYVGPDGNKVPLTAEEWFGWKSEVEQKVFEYRSSKKRIYKESPYYLEKAKSILPVKHRRKVCKSNESFEEGTEGEVVADDIWDGTTASNKTDASRVTNLEDYTPYDEDTGGKEETLSEGLGIETTENETEWEDVGEVE